MNTQPCKCKIMCKIKIIFSFLTKVDIQGGGTKNIAPGHQNPKYVTMYNKRNVYLLNISIHIFVSN